MTATYSYDAANQPNYEYTPSARTTYTFDSNGNLQVENAAGWRTAYTWDSENMRNRDAALPRTAWRPLRGYTAGQRGWWTASPPGTAGEGYRLLARELRTWARPGGAGRRRECAADDEEMGDEEDTE